MFYHLHPRRQTIDEPHSYQLGFADDVSYVIRGQVVKYDDGELVVDEDHIEHVENANGVLPLEEKDDNRVFGAFAQEESAAREYGTREAYPWHEIGKVDG